MQVSDLFDQFPEEEECQPEFPFVEWNGMTIRLLNTHHSLWGDKLAEAGKIAGSLILEAQYNIIVANKSVLELGAGCGLPSVCCCIKGAKTVVSTDYPDPNLLENLRYNLSKYSQAKVIGHLWGKDPETVLSCNDGSRFDIIILSDLIFNHVVHRQLLKSVQAMLQPDGYALVLFTHHRVHLIEADLNFFTLAENEFELIWKEVATIKHPPMFKDTGDIEVRTTAHIGFLRRLHTGKT
jgi:nicotinamide N-methyltransferase